MFKKISLLTTASLVVLGSTSTMAAEKMSMEEIQAQLQQLAGQVQNLSKVVEQQNQIIKQQEAALSAQQAATSEALANIQPAAGGISGDVKISMKPSPKIESADGKYSFQPFGRGHFDITHFDDDASDQDSNMNLRRARLGAKGKLGEDVNYKAEVDFAEEAVALKSFYVEYTGFDTANIRAGNHKPSFGLQQNTSSNYIQLIERSAPTNAFTRGEILGINALAGGDNWSLGLGVFGEDPGNDDTGNDEETSIDVRGSVNLLGLMDEQTDNVLHVGAGMSHRRTTDDTRFRVRPTGDGPRIVDTGAISETDNVNIYGVELAGVFGPFSAQAEYFDANVNRSNNMRDAEFDGFYAQASWLLTGESRPYSASAGTFKRIKPNNPFSLNGSGWGAWEAVARYEDLDLNDVSAGVTGGELNNTTIGVNWYITDHLRMMANMIDVDTDSNAVVANDDPTIYNLRTQWDF